MGKIKVLNIIGDLSVAGAQTVVMNNAKHFINDNEFEYIILVISKRRESKYEKEADELGLRVIYCDYSPVKFIPGVSLFINWVRCQIRIKKHIEKIKPDIIHTHITPIFPFVIIPGFLCRVNLKFHTLHSDPYALPKVNKLWAKLAFNMLHYYPICVTEWQAERAKQVYNLKDYSVIHNGIDFTDYLKEKPKSEIREQYGISEDSFVIGFAGRLNKIKNVDFLIDIFKEYSTNNPQSMLLIAGEGEEKAHLIQKVSEMGLEHKVRFIGLVHDISLFYRLLDVFMLTSFFESSSIVTVEAQLCKTRCVVSKGIPESVIISDKVCRIGLDESINNWIDAISGLYPYEERKAEANEYNIDVTVSKLKELYREKFDDRKSYRKQNN